MFKKNKSIILLDYEIEYNPLNVSDKENTINKIKQLIYERRYNRRNKYKIRRNK